MRDRRSTNPHINDKSGQPTSRLSGGRNLCVERGGDDSTKTERTQVPGDRKDGQAVWWEPPFASVYIATVVQTEGPLYVSEALWKFETKATAV